MRKYKLDTIVREYMIESLGAVQIDNRYARLLQIAISGLKNLNRDNAGVIKIERIAMDGSNFIANLPNDYLVYKKIFVCVGGQQIALALNPNMCPPEYDSCGDLEVCGRDNTFTGDADGPLWGWSGNVPITSYGQFTGRQFGVGGGTNGIGYYKIYPNEGYIAFQGVTTVFDEVIMEYLADIDSVDGNIYVHPNDVEAIKAYMHWKYIQRSAYIPFNEKESARRQFGLEKKQARIRHNSFNVNDLMLAYRSAYRSSPAI